MTSISIALKIKPKNGILQSFIEQKGWSQADFARALNCSQVTVSQWFNFKSAPDKMYWDEIYKLTGTHPLDIFPSLTKEQKRKLKPITIYKKIDLLQLATTHDRLSLAEKNIEDDPDYFELKENINRVLTTLTQREQRIIKNIFYEGMTLKEAGEKESLSPERVRQIEYHALRKLRQPSRKKLLKEWSAV